MGSHVVLSDPSEGQEEATATASAISSTAAQPAFNAQEANEDAEPGLVACQFSSNEVPRQFSPTTENAEMRRVSHDKTSAKPFQSKLTLTLRYPENGRKSPARQPTPQALVGAAKPVRFPTPTVAAAGPGPKHERARLQTFPANGRPPQQTGSTPGPLNGHPERHPVVAADIPVPDSSASGSAVRVLGSSTSLDGLGTGGKSTTEGAAGLLKGKIPPAPPPRTTSCPTVATASIPAPPVGVTALHHRAFRKGKSMSLSSQPESDREILPADSPPSHHSSTNPLMLSEPVATSSPTLQPKFSSHRSLDSQKNPRLRKQNSVRSMTQEETTDEGAMVTGNGGLIRKSSKSAKAEAERLATRKLRKQSQISLTSLDNIHPLGDRNSSRLLGLNNVSISSSSGLDSPTKSDRRKRRVSIKFNKRTSSGAVLEEERPGILTNFRTKSRCDETDGTTSDRERTNSVSSRTSSVARRKLSTSSTRTVFHEEKIPWCGCWGNGCV